MVAKLPALLLTLALCALAATSEQTSVRYLDLPSGAQPRFLATDVSGNLFIVSNILEPSGRAQIRVLKTDSQGNTLANLDFGSSGADTIAGAAVDPNGNLIVAGSTSSADFPLVSPLIASTSSRSAFVTKIDSQLIGILFSTRIGGIQQAEPFGDGTSAGALTLDGAGNIYISGSTFNTDFPITPGAFQSAPPSSNPFGAAVYAYITEISADDKRIVFSTYFGSDGTSCAGGSSCIGAFGATMASAIALDAAGDVVIAGTTTSNQLPVTPGAFGLQCGCDTHLAAGFLAKIDSGGSKFAWATYLPAAGLQFQLSIQISSISLDNAGSVIVVGSVGTGLPVTTKALQNLAPGLDYGGFVTKFDSTAQQLLFSTYFGGGAAANSPTGVTSLVVDSQGTLWITGGSAPGALPVPVGTPLLGSTYVASLSSDGSSVMTALTAPSGAAGQAIVLTGGGAVTVLGSAASLLLTTSASGPSLVGVANSAALSVGNAVAPYELISLYGIGLGPSPAVNAEVMDGALTSLLGGVQILFDGTPAPLLYAGATQINAIVPSEVIGRDTTSLMIVTPSGTFNGPTMLVRPSQPGVFGTATGIPYSIVPCATALNQDGSLNSPANPAMPGSIVTVWATGGGTSSFQQQDGKINVGPLGAPMLPLSVLTPELDLGGGLSLEVLYGGDAPQLVAGVLQINFRLPAQSFVVSDPNPRAFFQLQIGDEPAASFSVYARP